MVKTYNGHTTGRYSQRQVIFSWISYCIVEIKLINEITTNFEFANKSGPFSSMILSFQNYPKTIFMYPDA